MKLFYKTEAVQQGNRKKQKQKKNTKNWPAMPSHALAPSVWDGCENTGLLRQNSDQSLRGKGTCAIEHSRQTNDRHGRRIEGTIAVQGTGRAVKNGKRMVTVLKNNRREMERRKGPNGKWCVAEALVMEMVMMAVAATGKVDKTEASVFLPGLC